MFGQQALVHGQAYRTCTYAFRATPSRHMNRSHSLPTPVCQARKKGRDADFTNEGPGNEDHVQEIITFFTSDGVVRIPGNRVLRPAQRRKQLVRPMPTWEEQSLCIGATFSVAATNGMDDTRRVSIEGFCQSVDYLFASVQDALESDLGGEVLMHERQIKSGLHEVLKLTVAVPFLFGVPPQLEVLK
ncbi:hypothetical protein PLESTF_001525900 [Pleodorina starrii]|nr:hypothetical protein PLESTM_000282400 [Pleodorina starrii]GLC74547.1 hypothetical protein PLESTF_001525900 [Pleodorina starrii]